MRTLSLIALASCLSGCILHGGGGDAGGGGGPSFSFANCAPGCALDDHPVAAGGARTAIRVSGVAFADVRSSDPSVATFARQNDTEVAVTSGAAGQTTLQLLDGGGVVVASAVVTVVATARLDVNRGWSGDAPRILEGSTQRFHVTTLDAAGAVTKGDGAVRFTLGGTLTPAVAPLAGDSIAFSGTPGGGTITADCPDTSLTQPITVVAAADLTGLDTDVIPQPNDTAVVTIVPRSADGGVYTDPCAWQTSDTSVTLADDVGPTLELGPGELAVFNLNRAGTFTATCTIAGHTATVTLQR